MDNTIIMSKYQGLGNDYLILDPNKNRQQLAGKKTALLCERGFGIGADGVLYGPVFKDDGIFVKIYNADGSETAMSGNGIRIFAKYLLDQGYVKDKEFTISTENGARRVRALNDRATEFAVEMGQATFWASQIPVAGEEREVIDETFSFGGETCTGTCLSVGNPHCVLFMEHISPELVKRLGPLAEGSDVFPHRVNLQLAQVIDRANVRIEIFERGSGYTAASGTGSCAVAAAAHRLGKTGPKVNIHQPGGTIEVSIGEDGQMVMTGSVGFVADISIAESFFA